MEREAFETLVSQVLNELVTESTAWPLVHFGAMTARGLWSLQQTRSLV